MPRDYKHRADRRKKRKTASPWLGVVTGLLIGLFVAFLVFIKMNSGGQPPQVFVKESIQAQPAGEDERDVRKDEKAAIPPPPEPRFDFYTLLPEMEIVVPEQQIRGKPEQGVRQVEQPGTYYLQVGSFKNSEQADRLKAELALKGFETIIQKVTIDNNKVTDTWHRVRVGPFSELEALNRGRRKLKADGIESSLVRVKG
jgi:cell division protein FtsN